MINASEILKAMKRASEALDMIEALRHQARVEKIEEEKRQSACQLLKTTIEDLKSLADAAKMFELTALLYHLNNVLIQETTPAASFHANTNTLH